VSDALAEWGCEVSSRDVEVCPMPIAEEFGRRRKIPPPDGPIVGVGRLVREKGFDTLLRAVAQIEIADRPKLVIIGEGEEREALVYEADSLGVDLLLVGRLPPEKVADWYLEARFVVVPSRREGFGLVAAEAAACGRAVVGTRVGGLPELIEHKVSGLLVEPDDEDELSEAIGSVELNWGSAGPERVEWLSKERHAQYLISLYSSLDSQ
jgi:glycosyltransferase involved in cell wall biosynthesis